MPFSSPTTALVLVLLLSCVHVIRATANYQRVPQLTWLEKLFFCSYDFARARELRRVSGAFVRHGVRMDFMVTSHVLLPNGVEVRQDLLLPRTTEMLSRLHRSGTVRINAHGVVHVNRARLAIEGVLDSREYLGLGEAETRVLMERNSSAIRETFGRRPSGFTAPAWGYEQSVTKKVASSFFRFIVEKNSVFLCDRSVQPLGRQDPDYGFVHAPETWEYGMQGENEADVMVWDAFVAAGVPVHFLMHGPRCPTQPGTITDIAGAGAAAGVEWVFLEDLVELALQFSVMSVTRSKRTQDRVEIHVRCPVPIERPTMLGSYVPVASVEIDGARVREGGEGAVWIPALTAGQHIVTVQYERPTAR